MSIINKAAILTVVAGAMLQTAQAAQIEITFTNNAPTGGTYLTPLWVGVHDGSFDAFNVGDSASLGIETIAEVGNPMSLAAEFSGSGVDGVVSAAPVAPGGSFSLVLDLANDGSNNYLSFASMLLPSSDFFIGNDDAFSIASVLNGGGPLTFDIATAYDAGTEVNDFTTSAGNGLFTGAGLPATNAGAGVDENGVIRQISGSEFSNFLNIGSADVSGFNFDNYSSIASIEVSSVPEPTTLSMLLLGMVGLGFSRRKKIN